MASEKDKSQVKSQVDDSAQKKKSSKTVLIVSLVVGGFFAFLFVLFMLLVLVGIMSGSSVATYKTTDLVPVSNSDISFTRPKQWVDVTNVDSLTKDFGLELANPSAYGDEIITDKDGKTDVANAFVIFGRTDAEENDIAVLKTPEFKTKFEELMGQQLSEDTFRSDLCEELADYGMNYNYDYNGFPVSVAVKFNCLMLESARANDKTGSVEVRMAMIIAKDGKSYLYMLVAKTDSWVKNEPVYLQMLEDFKAK